MMRRDTRFAHWSKDQWWILFTLTFTHFCNGMCVSLQAPFFPAEAEKKGADATEYGLVFGIFELTVFLVSPLVGKIMPRLGASKAFSIGISITGTMCIAFGLLIKIQNLKQFLALSFMVRIVEAVGNSAFLTASFSMVAQQFHDSVATVFSLVEMAFGVGMILGPTVGGALYQQGGYCLPFITLGSVLLLQALLTRLTLSKVDFSGAHHEHLEGERELGFLQALVLPRVLLAMAGVFSASASIGFLQATLERHLAQFDLTPVEVGFFFMVYGAAYALLNPFWGWMADKISPRLVILCGSMLMLAGFLLVGPVPFIPLHSSYNLIMASVVLAGVGLGAQLVAAFTEAQKTALREGFPDDLSTYSLVSSLWTSSFALGAFVGPTAAGLLYDDVGFPWSTMFNIGMNLSVIILCTMSFINSLVDLCAQSRRKEGYSALTGSSSYQTIRKETGRLTVRTFSFSMDTPRIIEVEQRFSLENGYQSL